MSDIAIRPARRGNAKPLVGFYSESNGGKTYNALMLARGFVGPQGKITMIETESGRGEAYSDPQEYPEFRGPNPESNYDVISLRDNFSPERYSQAITAAEKSGTNALIVDSGSHEWEAAGGVLDMAAERQKTMKGALVWQKPKIDHQKFFMLRLMQTPISIVILCMRAKYPMEEVQVNGKKEWKRATKLEPKQSEDVLFEMMVHGWFDQEAHNFHPTKLTGRGLAEIFPSNQLITLETGKRFADWASGKLLSAGAAAAPAPKPTVSTPESPSNQPPAASNTPAPTSETLTDAEDKNAREQAKKGSQHLATWWKGLLDIPGAQKRHAEILPTLKRIAEDADAGPPPDDTIPA